MKTWIGLLAAAAALYGAALVSRSPTGTALDTARSLARPLALPFLWQGVLDRRGDSVGEYVARGRLLLRFLPGWIDGHLYFASQLVFDGREPGRDPQGACDRLFAALAWLEEVADSELDRRDEILAGMASLVEIRAAQDPALAEVIRRREGRDPFQIADDLLSRAGQARPTANLRERRVFLAPKLMASALRIGDDRRFALVLEQTLRQAQELRDRDLAVRVSDDLKLLRDYWNGDVELAALRQRVFLTEVVPFLPERKP